MGFAVASIGVGCYLLGVYTSEWIKPLIEKAWRKLKTSIESRG